MSLLGPLHEERLSAVRAVLLGSGVDSVMDLGCGSGLLLEDLVRLPRFERLLGMDASPMALRAARQRLLQDCPERHGRLSLLQGCYTRFQPELHAYRAATLVETIEHMAPERLSGLERALFAGHRPELVAITTPNVEYNSIYGLPPGRFRDPDHRFEWDRQRFRAWASGIARRNGYRLRLTGIGDPDPDLGAPTQMAVFIRDNG